MRNICIRVSTSVSLPRKKRKLNGRILNRRLFSYVMVMKAEDILPEFVCNPGDDLR
jgi:hypothetical protein